MKTAVLEAIGEIALSRASEVNAALATNDRVKYLLTLLQMALDRADHPEQAPLSLASERIACGIDDTSFDDFVATARREGDLYRLRGCNELLAQIARDMRVMAAPVIAARGSDGELARRVEMLLTTLPDTQDDLIDRAAIEGITRIGSDNRDSLHQLVMDLHKVLNGLAAELGEVRRCQRIPPGG
jgi:hypothetical protein